MKPIIANLLAFLCLANLCEAGNAKVVVSLGTPAVRAYCPPARVCSPVVYRPLPNFCTFPAISYYPWGASVIAYPSNTGNGFTTISTPASAIPTTPPTYRVPAPVLPTQTVTAYPTAAFHWKR